MTDGTYRLLQCGRQNLILKESLQDCIPNLCNVYKFREKDEENVMMKSEVKKKKIMNTLLKRQLVKTKDAFNTPARGRMMFGFIKKKERKKTILFCFFKEHN